METVVPQCENTRLRDNTAHSPVTLLSSLYLAPVEYYNRLHRAGDAVIETHDNYLKQSYRNRCTIAGAAGPLSLSVPVEKPVRAKCRMKDIRIADHGNWRHLHWNAIVSAYNSTPFFPYYEDDFRPFYEQKVDFLLDWNEMLRQLVCRLIGIETAVTLTTEYRENVPAHWVDLREAIHPKKRSAYEAAPYYQVFAGKHGFLPNLSIIDLLFNMGNESRLYL